MTSSKPKVQPQHSILEEFPDERIYIMYLYLYIHLVPKPISILNKVHLVRKSTNLCNFNFNFIISISSKDLQFFFIFSKWFEKMKIGTNFEINADTIAHSYSRGIDEIL